MPNRYLLGISEDQGLDAEQLRIAYDLQTAILEAAVDGWPKNAPIVTLCACPEDASAIQAARHLLGAGFLSVKPLKGGYEAWMALNRPAAIDHAGATTG